MENYSLYVGIVAGICTAVSLLPQLIKIIKKKESGDISFWMLAILLLGLGCWIYYGILQSDYPIIITNSFSFLTNVLIIFFAIKYRKHSQRR